MTTTVPEAAYGSARLAYNEVVAKHQDLNGLGPHYGTACSCGWTGPAGAHEQAVADAADAAWRREFEAYKARWSAIHGVTL